MLDSGSYCPKAVIFDLYGTLIFEDPDSTELQRRLAAILGVDADAFIDARMQTLRKAMLGEHATSRDRAREVLGLLGEAPTDERVELLATNEERIRRGAIRLAPGAIETLAALRSQGLKIGVVSNGTDLWRMFLAALDLEPYFDEVAISCEHGRCKPDPELFQWVLDRLGMEPEECIYVGDGDGGEMEAARDLGMVAILIDQPHSWVRQTGVKVYHDRRISHLGELLRIVCGPT